MEPVFLNFKSMSRTISVDQTYQGYNPVHHEPRDLNYWSLQSNAFYLIVNKIFRIYRAAIHTSKLRKLEPSPWGSELFNWRISRRACSRDDSNQSEIHSWLKWVFENLYDENFSQIALAGLRWAGMPAVSTPRERILVSYLNNRQYLNNGKMMKKNP